MDDIKIPKKLIEVALPLDAINKAAAREKSIRHGHPSTLHLWWARRPLAAARAVIFAQMVNDPGYERHLGRGMNKEKAAAERERLFKIIEDLVQWESTNNEEVLARAREEIWKSWREICALNKHHSQAADLFNPDRLPAFHDPFAGGGAIPLEGQRLGLEVYASDLNPVAVTINKAMIEIPPRFRGQRPVGPMPPQSNQPELVEDWSAGKCLAEDVRRYGAWVRGQAEKRIGHLYPKIKITHEMAQERPDLKALVGQELTVIAWLWARTVNSPNPAFSHAEVPLASSFVLSSREGSEAYVEPVVKGDRYRFEVKIGLPPKAAKAGTKLSRGANFQCILSGAPIEPSYIKAEGMAGRIGARLMAIVAEGSRSRVYISPTAEHESIAAAARPSWRPETDIPPDKRSMFTPLYGLTKFAHLFTPRQLVALTTFSDLVKEAINKCHKDATAKGLQDDGIDLDSGGSSALAYAQAVGMYLAFAVDRMADRHSTIATWDSSPTKLQLRNTFARQAIPMTWDFGDGNVFCNSSGAWAPSVEWIALAIEGLPGIGVGTALQADASSQSISSSRVISTDPPYYDNIGYADLSDFFYVWLRRSLKEIFPGLFATVAVPKADELVANPYRHGGKEAADTFFLDGMKRAIGSLVTQAHPAFPITIYYAFKQSETENEAGTSSTGWETFLQAVIETGLSITGTWPMRTELGNRMIGSGANALASSIILVCRRRETSARTVSRREFMRELNSVLPESMSEMTRGGVNSPVAPVDLSQAIIGPGMACFSQYAAVLEADGNRMTVRTALQLINRFLAEDDFDHDTQFCLHWFETHGWSIGKFGEADVLARAKGTSVDGLRQAGAVKSGKGELRLLRSTEMPKDWSPERDERTPIWEALHQMIRALNQDGESAAGAQLARMPALAEPIRALAYRLYTLCERKGWAEEARAYNELVTAWTSIEQAAGESGLVGSQAELEI